MYGYDARTLRELCKARHATKVQRMNMLALPEPTQDMVRHTGTQSTRKNLVVPFVLLEWLCTGMLPNLLIVICVVQVHVNSVAVCGRAERVWLLGLKWAMDRDMYTIELLTEVRSFLFFKIYFI